MFVVRDDTDTRCVINIHSGGGREGGAARFLHLYIRSTDLAQCQIATVQTDASSELRASDASRTSANWFRLLLFLCHGRTVSFDFITRSSVVLAPWARGGGIFLFCTTHSIRYYKFVSDFGNNIK